MLSTSRSPDSNLSKNHFPENVGSPAIMTPRFECVRMTVGTLLHTNGMGEGMTTITRCRMLSDSRVKKNELFLLFFIFFCPEHPL
jgi:hypothetical protein